MRGPARTSRPVGSLLRGWRAAAALGPALVVLLLGGLIFTSERGYTSAFARVEASFRTEAAVERAFSGLREAEIGQRGYLISRQADYLVLYTRGGRSARAELEALLRTAPGLAQHARLLTIAGLAERRLARLDSGLAVLREIGRDSAFVFASMPAGRAIMDSIRVQVAALQADRERELGHWRATEERYHRLLDAAVFLGTPLAVVLALIGTTALARAERTQHALTQRAWRENEERRAAERAVQRGTVRARVLADAGAALASSLDSDQALDSAARAAVPSLADLCIVDVVELDGKPRRVAIAHQDDAVVQLVRESAQRQRGRRLPAEMALSDGQPVFVPVTARAMLEAAATEEIHHAAIDALDPGSLIAVPMHTRSGALGAITLVRSRERGEAFTPEDLDTATELARRTASAIETARVFRIALAARAEAEEANRAKSTFLATMSHELRTPLNAVLGYIDLLDAELSGPLTPAQRDYVERVRASGRHLLNLIAEILDLAKVEAGQMHVRADRLRLAPIIGSAVELVRPLAETRRITLTTSCPPDIAVLGDEDRMRQILVNLLSNGVKFTEPGGSVTIGCASPSAVADASARLPGKGPWVGVTVRDTGIGIPSEKLEAVFAPFVQVDSGHTRQVGGTGLGLSISRSFARLMDGDLTVESILGSGSTFTLWLPASCVAAEGAATASGESRAASTERRVEVGRALSTRAAEIVRHLSARLREDPVIPQARMLSQADLEDHIAGYVTDLAQSITIVDAPAGADRASLARDGDALQYAYAVRHGAQRRRLGWPDSAVRREYAILADEIEEALRRSFGRDMNGLMDDVVPLLRQLNEAAMRRALEGWRG